MTGISPSQAVELRMKNLEYLKDGIAMYILNFTYMMNWTVIHYYHTVGVYSIKWHEVGEILQQSCRRCDYCLLVAPLTTFISNKPFMDIKTIPDIAIGDPPGPTTDDTQSCFLLCCSIVSHFCDLLQFHQGHQHFTTVNGYLCCLKNSSLCIATILSFCFVNPLWWESAYVFWYVNVN